MSGKLNQKIELDEAETDDDPPNPNPRGFRGRGEQRDPLDDVIATFNEKYFAGWDVTPEEQCVKFLNIVRHVIDIPNYETQAVNSLDEQNRRLALEKINQASCEYGA